MTAPDPQRDLDRATTSDPSYVDAPLSLIRKLAPDLAARLERGEDLPGVAEIEGLPGWFRVLHPQTDRP